MPLALGTRLGPYEITCQIGAGGMGEVYKGRDTRLDRIVAIKTLSPLVTADPAFHERFDREARAISKLNHPHICTLYDVGTADGVPYLVLEYLEGETLAERHSRGALPLGQVLTIGAEICDALDNAHRHGIVHRDLKPANVMLTKSGAKLLDFGLARPASPAVATNVGGAPTVSVPLTAEGTLLGTLQYMAPEQVEGKEADARSDIFACGAVLHEMVTGTRAFEGKTAASLIAAILERQPPPLSSLQKLSPPALDHIVARCLAKDPDERWRSSADVMRELLWIRDTPPPSVIRTVRPAGWRVWALAASGLVLGIMLGALVPRWMQPASRGETATPQHLAIAAPEGYAIAQGLASQFALSRDGSIAVFSAGIDGNYRDPRVHQLFVKRLDAADATPIPGAEGGYSPFLSPDGSWVGFVRSVEMLKIPLKGGPVIHLATVWGFSGASWGDDGFIIYSPVHGGGIWRVSENGGQAEQITQMDAKSGERGHHQPFVLPGSKAFFFTIEVAGRSHDDARIAVQTLGTSEHHVIIEGGMAARSVAADQIVYGRAGQLMAIGFDPTRLRTVGTPAVVMAGVRTNPNSGAADFGVADSGALAYVPGTGDGWRMPLQWVARDGTVTRLPLTEADYRNPRLSPSLDRAAVAVGGADDDVWIVDLARSVRQRATSAGDNIMGPWFSSGDRLALTIDVEGVPALYAMSIASTAAPERLVEGGFPIPSSFSPDGSLLAYSAAGTDTGVDIWTWSVAAKRKQPLVQTPFDEYCAMFSPDGEWIAYVSHETGRPEVVIAHYPDLGRKTIASVNGGEEPVWARSGRELFYRQNDGMMAVPISAGSDLKVGQPTLLFRVRSQPGVFGVPNYDVTADGKRFLMVGADASNHAASHVNYVVGWAATLSRMK